MVLGPHMNKYVPYTGATAQFWVLFKVALQDEGDQIQRARSCFVWYQMKSCEIYWTILYLLYHSCEYINSIKTGPGHQVHFIQLFDNQYPFRKNMIWTKSDIRVCIINGHTHQNKQSRWSKYMYMGMSENILMVYPQFPRWIFIIYCRFLFFADYYK
jgi:hypothetical protein